MDDKETMKSPRPVDMHVLQEVEVESEDGNFQNVICDLLEKNGVMSDLRAYLRQSIVNVLRSADTGEMPACQNHFAQRLELASQAINILIAEYLLCYDFSYSLSVFIAELPLANMVFDFANNLMKGEDPHKLRFKNKDVWSILNYLGIKCDFTFVRNVLDSYHNKKTPLLLCILKNLFVVNHYNAKSDISTPKSPSVQSETLTDNTSKIHAETKCQHVNTCPGCSSRLQLCKEKYLKAKLQLKNQTSIDSMRVQQFLNNVDTIEANVISEMFEDVRAAYENEMDKMRIMDQQRRQHQEQDRAAIEQTLRQEMEAALRAREEELERGVRAKKQFLWELARSLRAQHEHVAKAARAVTRHAHRLRDKEDKQKSELGEMERLLKRRWQDGPDDSKPPRQVIQREPSSHDQLKEPEPSESHSEASIQLLKELSVLKQYIMEAGRSEPKCLIDRCTITDVNAFKPAEVWNNEQDVKVPGDDRIKNSQVVNDLKKKNVNFCVDLASVMRNPEESLASVTSGGTQVGELVSQLKQENERLREHARQQEQQVQQLSQSSAVLRAELSFARELARPQTAAASVSPFGAAGGCESQAGSEAAGARRAAGAARADGRSLVGAGEELALLATPARALLPGDPVPFIGLLRDREARPTSRRLLNHWKRSRRLSSPRSRHSPTVDTASPLNDTGSPGPSCKAAPAQDDNMEYPDSPSMIYPEQSETDTAKPSPTRTSPSYTITDVNRTKSAKSVIREAKEKLKNHARTKPKVQKAASREKSPASVLQEAKLKLRKLEIEAEAAERSYRDYKKRQMQSPQRDEAVVSKDVGDHTIKSGELTCTSKNPSSRKLSIDMNTDFNKYLSESIKKLNNTQFANRNVITAKPIPPPFSELYENRTNDFLETPLVEFRKQYRHQHQPEPVQQVTVASAETRAHTSPFVNKPTNHGSQTRTESPNKTKNRAVELGILQNNKRKMSEATTDSVNYKLREENAVQPVTTDKGPLLTIEVEPCKGVAVINCTNKEAPPQNLVVVVQSKVDTTADASPAAMSIVTARSEHAKTSSKQNKERSERDRSRSMSPEQAARLTRNDVLEAIFHKDAVTIHSSSEIRDSADFPLKEAESMETNKEESYEEDFSGDQSRSSPVSLPVSPPDDSFWNDA